MGLDLQLATATLGVLFFLAFLWAAWVSEEEGESSASRRLLMAAVPVVLVFLLPIWLPGALGKAVAGLLLFLTGGLLVAFLLPFPGRDLTELGMPVGDVDERDIMFSRATLIPGTDRFEEYYASRPENRVPDDAFREEPGLLQEGSAHFHRQGFAAADAAFWTIEMLRPFVEGEEPGAEGMGTSAVDGGADPGPLPEYWADEDATSFSIGGGPLGLSGREPVSSDPGAMARFLKEWTLKMGAHSVGITPLKDYHLYTHVGRGPEYGQEVDLDHPFALALTVEMDKEMVDRAPRAPTAMESALQYVRCGVMAIQLANLIRRLGFRARAHVDGNYRVICPLVAKDAGLGELGRMGLLMTPNLGPRVRIAAVTTDLPLEADAPAPDLTTIDFCLRCRKCADACPSKAISFVDPEEDENGTLRWRIDSEACFTLWGKLGTDCARCMAVCPYSHPDNALHAGVRWGIRNNVLFRKGAVWMDDLLYGRRPPPKEKLEWMEVPEASTRAGS